MENKTENALIAESAKLAALVDYQSGAVVSRTVLERETGSITLFAFDQGQGLSEHTAPFDALAFILDGEAGITVGERSLRVRAGEAVIMPAGKPHALQAVTGFKMMLVMVKAV